MGDENAIVDFKYSASPRITWWFDHHLSAFLTPADQQHFLAEQQQGNTRHFLRPNYTSCTSFIAHIARTRFGFDPAPVAELIRWGGYRRRRPLRKPSGCGRNGRASHEAHPGDRIQQDPAFIPG